MPLATDLVGRQCTYNEPFDHTETGLRYRTSPAVIRAVYAYVENGTSKYSMLIETGIGHLVECRPNDIRITKE